MKFKFKVGDLVVTKAQLAECAARYKLEKEIAHYPSGQVLERLYGECMVGEEYMYQVNIDGRLVRFWQDELEPVQAMFDLWQSLLATP